MGVNTYSHGITSTNLFRNSRRLLRSIGFCQGLEFTKNGDIFDIWESIHTAMALHQPICFATQGDFCGLLDFVKVWNLLKMEIFLIYGSQYIQPWHYINQSVSQLKATFAVYWILSRFGIY